MAKTRRPLFGVFGVDNPPAKAPQPWTQRAVGQGNYLPSEGAATPAVPWYLQSNSGYWTAEISHYPSEGEAGSYQVWPGVRGPQGTPAPVSDLAEYRKVGNGYPGVLPDQRYESVINDGPAPSSYRRFWNTRIMDTTPNRVGGGTSAGNDNQVVIWSLAGQLYGRPPSRLVSQPSLNQRQGVSSVPSVYARRTVG